MLPVILVDAETRKPLHTEEYTLYGEYEALLCVTTPSKAHGVFKTSTFAAASTVIMATPKEGGAIELTDLIISFEKKGAAFVTVSYYDGVNTANIIKISLNENPVNIAIAFNGRWVGWRDAYVQAVLSGDNAVGVVALGYLRHDVESPYYTEWNEAR
jgi:hypothetical protein